MTVPMALTGRARTAQDKARVLREALPWITRWAGRTVVVKYGGNVLADSGSAAGEAGGTPGEHATEGPGEDGSFAADIALLRSVGLRVVVVHGGGPQISALSERLGLGTSFVDGRRVTDEATLEVVRMVLLGQVNPRLVGLVGAAGAHAVGLAGTDGGMVQVRPAAGGALGLVGEIVRVDPRLLATLLDDGAVPVVATLGRGLDGSDYNVNADTTAGAIATALGADKLIYMTNVPGLYEDFGTGEEALLSTVSVGRLREMLETGALHTGMVPKVESMVAALDGGVASAHLLDGRVEHALLLEIFTDEGVGTMVERAPEATGGQA